MPEQIYQEKHVILEQITDQYYAETVAAAQRLRRRLFRLAKGPVKLVSTDFYDAFGLLFDCTHAREELSGASELNKQIEDWLLTKSENGDGTMDKTGLSLFEKYNSLLWKKGVLAVRK